MGRCSELVSGIIGGTAGRILAPLVVLALITGLARAEAPYPRYGVRVVDGDISDWNLQKDFFYNMHRAGKGEKVIESRLFVRYDCRTNTLYVLVLSEPGVPIITAPAKEAWVAIDYLFRKVVNGHCDNDGSPPDFAWVRQARDAVPAELFAVGYEASFNLAPGRHTIIVHADVLDDGGRQTSATTLFPRRGPLIIADCTVPVEQSSWGKIKSLYR